MKRASVVLLLVAAFLVVLVFLKYPRNPINSSSENVSSNIMYNSTAITPSSQESSEINAMASEASRPESANEVFTVKEYEGLIGIFLNDAEKPFKQINVDVASLPDADQTALREGIKVYSTDKLNQIIEDYES